MPLIRRYFTTGLIVLLSLVALQTIYVLITGELGWGEVKALLTALIGFAAGLNAITCLTCRHEVPKPWLAWCGVGLGISAPVCYWPCCGWIFTVTLLASYRRDLVWTLVYTHCLLPSLIKLQAGNSGCWSR